MAPTTPAAVDRYQPGHVLEAKTGGYLVLSRSTPGVWYLVVGESCSCPAGQRDVPCWHHTQVARFVKLLNEKMARPVAPAAPASFFVD